jgi:uncharacterized repeat protein (TIGR01451 family)
MIYVPNSARPPATYDEDTATLSWTGFSVAARAEAAITFAATASEVASPTIVANTAVISADGESIERRALVLLVPEWPGPTPKLRGSQKSVSQHRLGPGGTLTYTIRLHNSGTAGAIVGVTDALPPEVAYVAGSAAPAADYDAATGTLSWSDVRVPVRGDVPLSFAVTGTAVSSPTVVTNIATITAGSESFQRSAKVVLLPERPVSDSTPPVVHSLTIDDQDVLDSPAVTLHISATDDVELRWMYLKEWQWIATPMPRWELVQSSGWIPFQAEYPWTLGPKNGVHFVAVWVGDGVLNRSHVRGRALDFASLVQPSAEIPPLGVVPYLVYYDEGADVTATLTPLEGHAELYVWDTSTPGQPLAEGTQAVRFTTQRPSTYLFAVRGEPTAIYDLTIEPTGGPRPPIQDRPGPGGGGQNPLTEIMNADAPAGQVAEDLIALFNESGFDPLDMALAPAPRYAVYLPLSVR